MLSNFLAKINALEFTLAIHPRAYISATITLYAFPMGIGVILKITVIAYNHSL
jgi:hypothetical protein